jgi:hypothetical protein
VKTRMRSAMTKLREALSGRTSSHE